MSRRGFDTDTGDAAASPPLSSKILGTGAAARSDVCSYAVSLFERLLGGWHWVLLRDAMTPHSVISVLTAAGLAAILSAGQAEAAKPSCGLNNGVRATGEPIQLGGITGRTGPTDYSSSPEAAAAYFRCVNENGGIHGRPIAYTIEDDAWKPEQAAQLAAKLVNDKKVVALVAGASLVDCPVNSSFYQSRDVLSLTGVGSLRDCFFSKNFGVINAGPRISNLGAVQYMHEKFAAKSVVCIVPNILGVGEFACNGIKEWGADKGIVFNVIKIDASALDPTSTLLQAQSYKPDLIQLSLPRDAAIAFLKSAEEQDLGATIRFAAPTSVYNLEFPSVVGPYWSDKLFAQLELEPFDKSSPDMQNWYAILDKYGSPGIQRDTFAQAGYLAARFVTEELLGLDPAKIDRATVTNALRLGKQHTSDILCGPWYFGPGERHSPNHAGSIAVIHDGKWKTVKGCFEIADPDLADILATEKKLGLADRN